MARVNPAEYAEKWANRTGAATEDYKKGINKVQTAPSQAAIAAKEKMRAGVNQALDDGTWERGLQGVTLQDWKNKAVNIGAQRISSGVMAAKDKQAAMATKLLAAVDQASALIAGMPSTTFEQRIARMVAYAGAMHEAQIK